MFVEEDREENNYKIRSDLICNSDTH
jgi:hypothetical protein